MFSRAEAESVFRRLSARPVEDLPIAEAFALLIAFYETEPAEGAKPEDEDGDMLLFEWGTYDWQTGTGLSFEINLTRQVIYPNGKEQDIWQLRLAYGFEPNPVLADLKKGGKWCYSKKEAPTFRDVILVSPAFVACRDRMPLRMHISWEHQS